MLSVLLTAVGRFGDLEQHRSGLQISDFKTCEVDVVDVVLGFAKIVWNETTESKQRHTGFDLFDQQ